MYYDKSPHLPDPGSDEELPMLLCVLERDNMAKRALTLLTAVLSHSEKQLKAIGGEIDSMYHCVKNKEVDDALSKRKKLFDFWTAQSPFDVAKMDDTEAAIRKANQRRAMENARVSASHLMSGEDSLTFGAR